MSSLNSFKKALRASFASVLTVLGVAVPWVGMVQCRCPCAGWWSKDPELLAKPRALPFPFCDVQELLSTLLSLESHLQRCASALSGGAAIHRTQPHSCAKSFLFVHGQLLSASSSLPSSLCFCSCRTSQQAVVSLFVPHVTPSGPAGAAKRGCRQRGRELPAHSGRSAVSFILHLGSYCHLRSLFCSLAFRLTSLVPNSLISWIIISWHGVLTHSSASHQQITSPLSSFLWHVPYSPLSAPEISLPLPSLSESVVPYPSGGEEISSNVLLRLAPIPTSLSNPLAAVPPVLGSAASLRPALFCFLPASVCTHCSMHYLYLRPLDFLSAQWKHWK